MAQVELLARAVAVQFGDGGNGGSGAGPRLAERYEAEAHRVKALHGSYLLRLGELRVGLARHRALLFKVRRAATHTGTHSRVALSSPSARRDSMSPHSHARPSNPYDTVSQRPRIAPADSE